MAKGIWITIAVLIILVIGGYFFFQNSENQKEEKTSSKLVNTNCNIGDSRYTPNPDGVGASGPITGIESHSFINGETLNLCCNDASDLQETRYYKSCTYSENNVITHEILWKKIGTTLTKLKEVEPESGSICTYYFGTTGEI